MSEHKARIAAATVPAPPLSLRPSLPPSLPGISLAPDARETSEGSSLGNILGAVSRVELGQLLAQLSEIGLKSFGFFCTVLGFVGAILVYQAGVQALRIVPDTSTVGASYLELLVRDLGASMVGLMLATRVGSGIAAELGSMKVTSQLDALRLCHADPLDYLVAPRVLACALVTPWLTLFASAVAVLSGTVTGYLAFGINPHVFLDFRFVDVGDIATGLAKSIVFGLSVPVIAARAGISAQGGSEAVGDATTRAVVGGSLSVIVLGFAIGVVGQLVF